MIKSRNFDTELSDYIVYSDSMCFTCKHVRFNKEGFAGLCLKRHKVFTRDCVDYEREISICSKCKYMEGIKYSPLFESYVCGANHTVGFCRGCDDFAKEKCGKIQE